MNNYWTNKWNSWFSIVEILIWIFIFTLGLLSVYMLISWTLKLNESNKNKLIASSLALESIELVKNIRDSNYENFHKYNQINPDLTSDFTNTDNLFNEWDYFTIENNYGLWYPISVELINDFWEWKLELNNKMQAYRLCLDSENRYTYDCLNPSNKKTNFYRYISFDEVKYDDSWTVNIVDNALKVKAKVIWAYKWYYEIEINTIITDWKRF